MRVRFPSSAPRSNWSSRQVSCLLHGFGRLDSMTREWTTLRLLVVNSETEPAWVAIEGWGRVNGDNLDVTHLEFVEGDREQFSLSGALNEVPVWPDLYLDQRYDTGVAREADPNVRLKVVGVSTHRRFLAVGSIRRHECRPPRSARYRDVWHVTVDRASVSSAPRTARTGPRARRPGRRRAVSVTGRRGDHQQSPGDGPGPRRGRLTLCGSVGRPR